MSNIGPYQICGSIGSGSFATVYLARDPLSNHSVAIKALKKESIVTPEQHERFKREIQLMKTLDHPFIADFYELLEDENKYYIVLEYVEHGNILDFVNLRGELCEQEARHYFCELISALEYLHDIKNIAHRDLKAENVMLDRYNNIRLIDFGLSNVFTVENPYLKTACGSPAYAPPEMIIGEQYTKVADIWSAGILLYAMVQCELPFQDDNTQRLLQKIIYTEPHYPQTMSPQLRDLLGQMLQKDPKLRITLEGIKMHPWFSMGFYAHMMNASIGISNNWTIVSSAPDQEVIQKMGALGHDTHGIVEDLLNAKETHITAVYKMLRKDRIVDEMGEIAFGRQSRFLMPSIGSHSIPERTPTMIPKPLLKKPDPTKSPPTVFAHPAANSILRKYQTESGKPMGPKIPAPVVLRPIAQAHAGPQVSTMARRMSLIQVRPKQKPFTLQMPSD